MCQHTRDSCDYFHNNTKQHAVFHYPYFQDLLGSWTNFNTGVGELKHKNALKRHKHLTQQHVATSGYSILQGNIQDTTCSLLTQAIIDCNVHSMSIPCPFHVSSMSVPCPLLVSSMSVPDSVPA